MEHLHSVFISTYGILFLGTPHNGSDIAKMTSTAQRLVSAVVPKKVLDTDGQLLNALKEGSETLQNITDQFAPLMKRFHIYFFWEQEKTCLPHTTAYVCCLSSCFVNGFRSQRQVVDESSAAPILDNTERSGIGASHSQMCKFEDSSAPGYRTVAAALLRYNREASSLIAVRWSQAKDMLKVQRSAEASEMVRGL